MPSIHGKLQRGLISLGWAGRLPKKVLSAVSVGSVDKQKRPKSSWEQWGLWGSHNDCKNINPAISFNPTIAQFKAHMNAAIKISLLAFTNVEHRPPPNSPWGLPALPEILDGIPVNFPWFSWISHGFSPGFYAAPPAAPAHAPPTRLRKELSGPHLRRHPRQPGWRPQLRRRNSDLWSSWSWYRILI